MAENRKENRHQFQPGQSGNPGGRPKGSGKKRFLEHAEDALDTIVKLMKHGRSERIKLQAAQYLLDQGFGKAAMSMEITGAEFVDKLTERIREVNPELAEQLAALQDEVGTVQ